MQPEPPIAFVSHSDAAGLEIRVNFAIFAGRAATPAELDELAARLVPDVEEVSIVAEERHEVAGEVEGVVHQVRIEVDGEHLPTPIDDLDGFRNRLVATAEDWARTCLAERTVEPAPLDVMRER